MLSQRRRGGGGGGEPGYDGGCPDPPVEIFV